MSIAYSKVFGLSWRFATFGFALFAVYLTWVWFDPRLLGVNELIRIALPSEFSLPESFEKLITFCLHAVILVTAAIAIGRPARRLFEPRVKDLIQSRYNIVGQAITDLQNIPPTPSAAFDASAPDGKNDQLGSDQKPEHHLDWTDVRIFLETEGYTSLLTRLGRHSLRERFELKSETSSYGNSVSLPRLRVIYRFLYLINEAIDQHGKKYDTKRHSELRILNDAKHLQKLQNIALRGIQEIVAIRIFCRLISILIPVALIGLMLCLSNAIHHYQIHMSQTSFFGFLGELGSIIRFPFRPAIETGQAAMIYDGAFMSLLAITAFIAALPLAVMMRSIINYIAARIFTKIPTRSEEVTTRAASSLLAAIVFAVVVLHGSVMLSRAEPSLLWLFQAMEQLVFPFTIPAEGQLFAGISPLAFLATRLLAISMLGYLLFLVTILATEHFENNVHSQNAEIVTVPPEMLRIAGLFVTFVLTTGLGYSAVITYFDHVQSLAAGGPSSPATNVGPSGLGDFVPYSVFLALIGAAITLASRDLLENYFAGLALKVDPPFEEGDRIQIPKSGICEVRHIGMRSVKLYGIKNNSVIDMPHRELSRQLIENFTQPTLDYRRQVHISIPDEKVSKALCPYTECLSTLNCACASNEGFLNRIDFPTIPLRGEALLLFTSCLASGVKRSSPSRLSNQEKIKFLWRRLKENKISRADFKEQVWPFIELDENLDQIFCRDIPLLISGIESGASKSKHRSGQAATSTKAVSATANRVQTMVDDVRTTIVQIVELGFDRNNYLDYMTNPLQANGATASERHKFFAEETIKRADLLNPKLVVLLSRICVQISLKYFQLAKLLWAIKDEHDSYAIKRSIDAASLHLLDAPRVNSSHELSEDGSPYWDISLMVNVELAEQSDEIIHHINNFIGMFWQTFGLPQSSPSVRNLENLVILRNSQIVEAESITPLHASDANGGKYPN